MKWSPPHSGRSIPVFIRDLYSTLLWLVPCHQPRWGAWVPHSPVTVSLCLKFWDKPFDNIWVICLAPGPPSCGFIGLTVSARACSKGIKLFPLYPKWRELWPHSVVLSLFQCFHSAMDDTFLQFLLKSLMSNVVEIGERNFGSNWPE